MKTIKIKAARTSKTAAKVAGLLFCTGLFGLTLAPPSVAGGLVLGDSSISNQPIVFNSPSSARIPGLGMIPVIGPALSIIDTLLDLFKPEPGSTPIIIIGDGNIIIINDPYPDAPGGPEPLTTLGSAMGAGGLIWLKKRRSEKDRFSKGESLL